MSDQRTVHGGRRCVEQQILGNPAAPAVIDRTDLSGHGILPINVLKPVSLARGCPKEKAREPCGARAF
jgi:hypothetical protein